MPKSNSKNIRVFPDWFGIDNKSKQLEVETCTKLYSLITSTQWEWSSDRTGFWIESNEFYYRHVCDNGKYFNYPIDVKNFDINDTKIVKITKKYIGKISGSESRRGVSDEVDPYYHELARKDAIENPRIEEGFDWGHVKKVMEEE